MIFIYYSSLLLMPFDLQIVFISVSDLSHFYTLFQSRTVIRLSSICFQFCEDSPRFSYCKLARSFLTCSIFSWFEDLFIPLPKMYFGKTKNFFLQKFSVYSVKLKCLLPVRYVDASVSSREIKYLSLK